MGIVASLLKSLGFLGKSGTIVILGLDNAGKTTLLSLLRTGNLQAHAPTGQPNHEIVKLGGVSFNAHDLGGHLAARRVWRNYMARVDGIVYVVDAAATSRLDEAKAELQNILCMEEVQQTPVLILGNKVDQAQALSETDFVRHMGVADLRTGKQPNARGVKPSSARRGEGEGAGAGVEWAGPRPVEVFMSSVVRRWGFQDGFSWLAQYFP